MSQHDFSNLRAQYPAVIKKMPKEFTSHEFILLLARKNQKLYIKALNAYRNRSDPFRKVHATLSDLLHQYENLIDDLGKTKSKNIWGKSNPCHKWRKK